MVVIYFGCSMRGGYGAVSRQDLEKLQQSIKDLGHTLASEHQTKRNWATTENKLRNTEIHDRDYEFLLNSDLGVFEISNPSLGVGAEISDMLHLIKPVLCLFKRGLERDISAYIQGKEGSRYVDAIFKNASYADLLEAKQLIDEFIMHHS